MVNGWGPGNHLDFWAARAAGLVSAVELRAMTLLASLSDEPRFGFYARYGMYPALGNMSRRIYFIRRFSTVIETDDGRPVASWCVETRDRLEIPETDHVVALKNIVEGSEAAFREIGNRGGVLWPTEQLLMLRMPFSEAPVPFPAPFFDAFMPAGGTDLFDPLAIKKELETAAFAEVSRHREILEAGRRRAPDYVEPPRVQDGITLGGMSANGAYFNATTDNSTVTGIHYIPNRPLRTMAGRIDAMVIDGGMNPGVRYD